MTERRYETIKEFIKEKNTADIRDIKERGGFTIEEIDDYTKERAEEIDKERDNYARKR